MGTGEIPDISKRGRDAYRTQLENLTAKKSRRVPDHVVSSSLTS